MVIDFISWVFLGVVGRIFPGDIKSGRTYSFTRFWMLINWFITGEGGGGRGEGGVRVLGRGRGGWILFHAGEDNFAGEIICILECMFRGEIFCTLFGCRRRILGT